MGDRMVIFKIETINRMGMTHDVIACFTTTNIDIISMEVIPNSIYLKIPTIDENKISTLIQAIQNVQGVKHVATIHLLPSEERELQMHTILSTISEGILALDDNFMITSANRAANEILDIPQNQLIGRSFLSLWKSTDANLERCLRERKEILNVSLRLRKGNIPPNIMVSYFPIRSTDYSNYQGIIVVRDMKQIQKLIESANRSGIITLDDIVHSSTIMKQCIETAKKVAKTNATVLLQGESGTGKDLFARAIHFASPRANNPFVPINCAAIPEAILESELFGYEEGAFTGAAKGGKPGLFELAQGGTLFLDEIGELPLHVQAKLLRVLEDRMIRHVGGTRSTPIDVRIIVATNRNLSEMARKGLFREDLFYRLHVIPIIIPPLRVRKTDILLLAEIFIDKICITINRTPLSLSNQAKHMLHSYHFPGNVSELQNVIERSVYLCPEDQSELDRIYIEEFQVVQIYDHTNPFSSLKHQVEAYEKMILQNVLMKTRSARKTAVQLGISHTAVLNKVRKYNLEYLL
jgi:transcriptional regulator of aroF, aroG, tyrA and aromatic amino acid transport